MSAQERETKKNFIAIVSEAAGEQGGVEAAAKINRPVRRALLGLVAAMLNREANARRRSG